MSKTVENYFLSRSWLALGDESWRREDAYRDFQDHARESWFDGTVSDSLSKRL